MSYRDMAFLNLERVVLFMETRIAILGIIVENMDSVSEVNELLHEYNKYIIGRMGMPYRETWSKYHQYRDRCTAK